MSARRNLALSTVGIGLAVSAFFLACDGDHLLTEPTAPRRALSGTVQGNGMNVVLVIVDDLGWSDTKPFNADALTETPSIDRLAQVGSRFTRFYAAGPMCTPTRASLMTGKHPARLHITNVLGAEGGETGNKLNAPTLPGLPLEEFTIGEAFEEAGYATGYIGKWHLGSGLLEQGFQEKIAVERKTLTGGWVKPIWSNAKPSSLTNEAIKFIDRHRAQPFFLVLSHYSVHTPLESPPELTAKYQAVKAAHPEQYLNPTYAGMLEDLDQSLGRLTAHLAATGLSDSTIVVFVSDNGGRTYGKVPPTTNAPLRAGKGWLYEGGTRVPLILSGPGIPRGHTVDARAGTSDLFPTLLTLAGLAERPAQHVDGRSMDPLLRGGSLPDRPLFWHYPHPQWARAVLPSSAVRIGDFKLIEWLQDGRVELYDLAADPGEKRNLAATEPARVAELRTALHWWRADVGAAMPLH